MVLLTECAETDKQNKKPAGIARANALAGKYGEGCCYLSAATSIPFFVYISWV